MKTILIVPALAALVAVAACSKTETTNTTTNEVTVNETVATEGAPVDANATGELNTTAVDAATDNTLDAANATGNASNGL